MGLREEWKTGVMLLDGKINIIHQIQKENLLIINVKWIKQTNIKNKIMIMLKLVFF